MTFRVLDLKSISWKSALIESKSSHNCSIGHAKNGSTIIENKVSLALTKVPP